MSVFRYVLPCLLIVIAAAALASCRDDGKKAELLAPGDYEFNVSGTLEIEFVEESASAAPTGARQTQSANVSGEVTLKMGEDGSFSLEEWGISGTIQTDGEAVTITATDSPKEGSTGKTDSGGTQTDVYWKAETQNQTTYVGYNADAIGMSGEDPLRPGTRSFTQETGAGTSVPFMTDAGETFLNLRGARLDFNLSVCGQTPQAQPTTPAPQPTTPAPQPSPQAQRVRVEQEIKCQHTQPGVSSDLFDFVLAVLVIAAPQSSENGQPPTLVLRIASPGDQLLTSPARAGQEVPLAGATVTVSVQGPGVLNSQASGVTDASGQVTLRAGINKFGVYNMTIDSVVGADGTVYEFDQNSILSLTYEVGPVCELTPTPSP